MAELRLRFTSGKAWRETGCVCGSSELGALVSLLTHECRGKIECKLSLPMTNTSHGQPPASCTHGDPGVGIFPLEELWLCQAPQWLPEAQVVSGSAPGGGLPCCS